jgi:hypothetical protein
MASEPPKVFVSYNRADRDWTEWIGESCVGSLGVTLDGRTIVAGDEFGRVRFLRLVEADKTKPPIGDTKIQLLQHKV